MSQENVEVVCCIVDAWNRRDYSAALRPVAPEIRVESALGGGLDGTYEGIPGLQKWLMRFWGSFVDFRTEIEECIPWRTRSSSRDTTMDAVRPAASKSRCRNWHVCTVRDGKVVRYRVFPTKPEALEAVGLRE